MAADKKTFSQLESPPQRHNVAAVGVKAADNDINDQNENDIEHGRTTSSIDPCTVGKSRNGGAGSRRRRGLVTFAIGFLTRRSISAGYVRKRRVSTMVPGAPPHPIPWPGAFCDRYTRQATPSLHHEDANGSSLPCVQGGLGSLGPSWWGTAAIRTT